MKKNNSYTNKQKIDQPLTDKKTIQHLEKELIMVWKAINSTRGPFILTDSQQKDDPIIFANEAFLDLTGYTKEEVIGHNCRFLQGPQTDQKTIDKLRLAIKEKKDIRVQIYNYKKDGTPFWNDLLMSPIFNEEGELTHFMGLQQDDTERMQRIEELRKSQEELARSNQELEQFAYVASHDLQEPLRMIISYLGLLEKKYSEHFDDKAHKYINYAVDGGKRMQDLINDLLTFSRVKTRAKAFEKTNMNDVLDDVLFNLKVSITENNATIKHDTLPTISADSSQMIQLLQNLISNAIKYQSRDKKPEVFLKAGKEGELWHFTVSDNGIGINTQFYERIFNIFQRLHTREEYPGTGIGLAICKRIVERHNGKIWVESKIDEGSVFHFTLPEVQDATIKKGGDSHGV